MSGEEIADAVVAVTRDPVEEGAEPAVIEKNEEGKYALSVPGTYTVKASAEGYQVPGTEDTEYVLSDYQPKKDGETLTVTLIRTAEAKNTISFDLKDQLDEAVVNPQITVYPWNDKEAVVAPEADGSYKLFHGTNYGYTVKAEGYEDKTGSFKPSEDGVQSVKVNRYLSEQKFTFRVYDSKTNETLEGVKLTVKYGPTGEEESTYTEAQPDENGVYTIPIDNRVIAYGHKIGYEDDELGVWSLGFDPLKECSFGLKAYPVLTVDKTNAGMMKPAEKAYLTGEKTVLLPMENDSFSAVFVGDGREVDETKAVALAEDNTFTFDVEEFDTAFMAAFKSKKNGNWVNKQITVSKEESRITIVDDKADYTAVNAAIATVPEDLSIFTEESKSAVEAALAAVKTGKNSVEQASVDAMAKAIEDAVAGLIKVEDQEAADDAAALITAAKEATSDSTKTAEEMQAAVDAAKAAVEALTDDQRALLPEGAADDLTAAQEAAAAKEAIQTANEAVEKAKELLNEAETKASDDKATWEEVQEAVQEAEAAVQEAEAAVKAAEDAGLHDQITETLDEEQANTVVSQVKSVVKMKKAAAFVQQAEAVANNPESSAKDVEEAVKAAEEALGELEAEEREKVDTALENKTEDILNAAKEVQQKKAEAEKDTEDGKDNGQNSGGSKTPSGSTAPSVAAVPAKAGVAVGTTFNIGKITYQVTKADEATLLKNNNKKAKKAVIPAAVSYQGQSLRVTAIANKAFANNKKLTQVTIGKNVTSIGKQAFKGDKKLKKITFKGNLVKSIGKKAFNGINKKATFKAPKKVLKKYRKLIKKAGAPKTAKYKK